MTVVFIKTECPRHPGRYTMGEPCDRCIKEDFGPQMHGILDDWSRRAAQIIAPALTRATLLPPKDSDPENSSAGGREGTG